MTDRRWGLAALWGALLTALVVVGSFGQARSFGAASPFTPTFVAEIEGLEKKARSQWPNSFAGLWASPESGQVSVAFTDQATIRAEALGRELANPERLQGVDAKFSIEQLEATQERLIAARDASGSELARTSYDLGISLQDNQVRVITPEPTGPMREAVAQEFGDRARVEEGRLAQPDSCLSRFDCLSGLRAGIETLSSATATSPCSTAFVVKNANGKRELLSAGHCAGSLRYHAATYTGQVKDQVIYGAVDAERQGVSDAHSSRPFIYVTDDERARGVQSVGRWDNITVGLTNSCKVGVTTNLTCGLVLDKHYSPQYVENGNRFVQTSYCSESGDSGGAVFNGGRALGIHSGGDLATCASGSDYGIFGHIEFAENRLDVNVLLDG